MSSSTTAARMLSGSITRVADSLLSPLVRLSMLQTWGNHIPIFNDAGLETAYYKYYKPATKGLDLEGVLADIKSAPNKSVFLFHACAHNPTGVDPSPAQWKAISAAIKEKGHFVILDSAYQGRYMHIDTLVAFLFSRFSPQPPPPPPFYCGDDDRLQFCF
jgi:aspartate/tyrosine/aromatic aminotransferase